MPGKPDLGQVMRQVQEMQANLAKVQEELKAEVVEASAGGGMVTAKVTGGLELVDLAIKPEAIDPDDPELLEDLVLAAVNEAIRMAQEMAATRMSQASGGLEGLTGGLDLPGL
jgi:nucleoid-associated protein EbfC